MRTSHWKPAARSASAPPGWCRTTSVYPCPACSVMSRPSVASSVLAALVGVSTVTSWGRNASSTASAEEGVVKSGW